MDKAAVLIAGAGPVGLSLALALSRQGIRSILVEAKDQPDPHSRAPGIHARTQEIFKAWGVLDRFLEAGTHLEHADIWRAGDERPVASIDLSRMGRVTHQPGVIILDQASTERLLREAVAELGLCDVRFGHRVEDFSQDLNGVSARVIPTQGEPYVIEADFLAGCDGAKSRVRERLGLKLEGKTYQTKALLADVHFKDTRAKLPWPRFAARPQGALIGLRLGEDLWRIVAIDDGLPADATGQRVQALFGAGPFEEVWSSAFQLHCRKSARFRVGRVLLAGDAAHLNSPVGGQGMNSGIHDANALAWRLAYAARGGETEHLLDGYERERRAAVTMRVNRITDIMTRVVLLNPRVRGFAFGTLAKLVRWPKFLDFVLPRLGMLSYPNRPKDLRLVDMAADRGGLFFYGKAPRGDFSDLPIPTHVLAGGGRRGKVVLVRPDGFVGWSAFAPTDDEIRRSVNRSLGLTRTQGRLHALAARVAAAAQ